MGQRGKKRFEEGRERARWSGVDDEKVDAVRILDEKVPDQGG